MRRQGDKKIGFRFLINGIVYLVLLVGILLAVTLYQKEFIVGVFVPFIILILISIVLIIIGASDMITYEKHRKVQYSGVKSICKVTKTSSEINGKYYRRRILFFRSYTLYVEYEGESGNKYQQVVNVGKEEYKKVKKGDTIECFIKDELCYINPCTISVVEKKEA